MSPQIQPLIDQSFYPWFKSYKQRKIYHIQLTVFLSSSVSTMPWMTVCFSSNMKDMRKSQDMTRFQIMLFMNYVQTYKPC